jgi:hypothetical protein
MVQCWPIFWEHFGHFSPTFMVTLLSRNENIFVPQLQSLNLDPGWRVKTGANTTIAEFSTTAPVKFFNLEKYI